ncbi:MAG: hypothetical protein GWM92_02705, partial [Gemmatimonadetes bacterium]|nr:hypothetical protein [Gemmatimonadota bacterium]NIT85929.1 hypothetical protein [Gemmatimonadota bacterium]NIU34786.1 hypothetical protein [Gemmatimonadota bacterium]NIV60162.1 hypothetical protein [Gemmatimonadota bacterium]NIV81690.1 hypothetical protein [Gemmatimonadota bacterium]
LFSVFDRILDSRANYASWDVSSDDQRFIMVQLGGGEASLANLVVVQNFHEELKERVGR